MFQIKPYLLALTTIIKYFLSKALWSCPAELVVKGRCVSFFGLLLFSLYPHTCMLTTQRPARAQQISLSHGVLIVCRQAYVEQKYTHHMDKWILLRVGQLVELIRTDVNERRDVAMVCTEHKENTGRGPNLSVLSLRI